VLRSWVCLVLSMALCAIGRRRLVTSNLPLASVLAKTSYQHQQGRERGRTCLAGISVSVSPFPRPTPQGEVNAWDNADFRSAVEATGKEQLIVAGIVTEDTLAMGEGRVGVYIGDFLEHEAIGTCVGGGGQHCW
jgi:hypothetical protein